MEQSQLFANLAHGPETVAGVDEAGRGCLAGPVVAGACILPARYDLPGLTDSKQLTAARREELYTRIREQAVAWSVGVAWPDEIDAVNILQATFQAMGRAVRTLGRIPGFVRIDGDKTIPGPILGLTVPQEWVIKGDGTVPAISAASIMAKTFRDRLMVKLAGRYPGYGFDKHMGYGTKMHLDALAELGPCRMHRMTFRRVRPEGKPQQQGSLL
jgi:ribonuclease HII